MSGTSTGGVVPVSNDAFGNFVSGFGSFVVLFWCVLILGVE